MTYPVGGALVCVSLIVLFGCAPAPTATEVAVQPTDKLAPTATVTAVSTAMTTPARTSTHAPSATWSVTAPASPIPPPAKTPTQTPAPSSPPAAMVTPDPKAVVVAEPKGAVRECPSHACGILYLAGQGDLLLAMARSADLGDPWYQVESADGLGWIVGSSVDPVAADLWEQLPTPIPRTPTPTPEPPTATPTPVFTLATSAEEIVGTWQARAGRYYIRFNEDETFRQAHALDELDSQPYAVDSYRFEGTKMVIREVSISGVPTCGKKIGSYEIRLLESGNIWIVTIDDQCEPRAGSVAREYGPVR
ncbi:hypothetical protein ACFLWA_09670 [Chloroflexota bacterium]